MTNGQQQYINTIRENFYADRTAEERAGYRELASRVYANALRNPDTSLLELKLIFEPLQIIATSADFTENAVAVGRAITQPFTDSAVTLQGNQAFASVAATTIKLADDPLANIKGVWNGVQAIPEAAYQLAQHATGMLTMEERQRLAAMYDLPHKQRIQALHGVTLNDTAAMVSVGSLPGLLPNAITKAQMMMNDTSAAIANEMKSLGSYPVPALVVADIATETGLPSLPQVLSMTSKDAGIGSGPAEKNVDKQFNLADHEFPDPDYDHERIWYESYLDGHVKGLSDHMATLGLKNEAAQFQKLLNHMLNVQVTATASEYNLVLNTVQKIVTKAEEADYQQALASGLSVEVAENASQQVARQFNIIQQYVEYERDKRFIDLTKDQNKFALQEQARLDPDSVGYGRTAYPQNITERDMHHAEYLTKLRESVADLRVRLELLGLNDRAESLADQMRKLLAVSLENSKSIHEQRLADFMKIEEEAKRADIKNASPNISAEYFQMLQDGIGADLAHIKEEIGHDREYHIGFQLWRRQSGDERRLREGAEIATARDELFGNKQAVVTQEFGPER